MNRRRPEPVPGTVDVRLSGVREDVDTLISLIGRVAAGLPATTTIGLEFVHRTAPRANRRDPGERTYLTIRVHPLGGPR